MKMRKQITRPCVVLREYEWARVNANVANQKTRRKLHRKVFERIKESKGGTYCKYM